MLSGFSSAGEDHFLISTICSGVILCSQERRDAGQQKENHSSMHQLDIASEHSAGLWGGVGNEKVYQFMNMKRLIVPLKIVYQDENVEDLCLKGCRADDLQLCTPLYGVMFKILLRSGTRYVVQDSLKPKNGQCTAYVRKRTSMNVLLL